jgi:hypothetical protein
MLNQIEVRQQIFLRESWVGFADPTLPENIRCGITPDKFNQGVLFRPVFLMTGIQR